MIPLATISAQRVTHLYDLMDAAYAARSSVRTAAAWSLCHGSITTRVRAGKSTSRVTRHSASSSAAPLSASTLAGRTTSAPAASTSRVNVRGPAKVMSHLMFGVLVLAADPLLRWVP